MANDRPTRRAPIPPSGILDDETQRALGVDPEEARQATLVKALAKQIGVRLPGRMSGKTAALREAKRQYAAEITARAMIDDAIPEDS